MLMRIYYLFIFRFFHLMLPLFLMGYSPLFAQTPHIDSLSKVLKTQKEDTAKVNTINELARAYLFELNDYVKVGEFGEQQLTLARKINYKKGIAWGLLNRAIYYRSIGDNVTALSSDSLSLLLMKEIGDQRGETSCYNNIGLDYSNVGKYEEAIEYMNKGLEMKKLLNDKKGIAAVSTNMGNLQQTIGNYSKSLQFHFEALKIREEMGSKVGIAQCYINIGNVFDSQNNREEALKYCFKAVEISKEINDLYNLALEYNNIGGIYIDQKKYDDALEYSLKALQINEKLEDKTEMALNLDNIGKIYLLLNNSTKAVLYYTQALELQLQTNSKKNMVETYGGLGQADEMKNRFPEAEQNYGKMLSISKELDYKEGIRDAYERFAFLYKKQKQFEKALEYTQLFNNIKDSILNKENFKQVSELNTRFETDKKEKEILLLTKDQELKAKIIRQQQLVRWGLIGGLALLFVSVFSIYRRYHFKQKANLLLEKQKQEIETKNMLINDSIDYAKTIQDAILPVLTEVKHWLPESFILFKPKAIVSGDFYWLHKKENLLIFAVADCTGHGVPGAFMSILGYNMLENQLKKNNDITPSVILDHLNEEMLRSLSDEHDQEQTKHGMDISLVTIDTNMHQLQFSGAHNSIYIIRNGELIELKANKKGIGFMDKANRKFTNHTFQLFRGDMIYLHTDGFPDQIGGTHRKKFYYAPFKELLVSISHLDPEIQQQKLNQVHIDWMGEKMDQTDDILVMGIRY